VSSVRAISKRSLEALSTLFIYFDGGIIDEERPLTLRDIDSSTSSPSVSSVRAISKHSLEVSASFIFIMMPPPSGGIRQISLIAAFRQKIEIHVSRTQQLVAAAIGRVSVKDVPFVVLVEHSEAG
jgi:hypothetical protein